MKRNDLKKCNLSRTRTHTPIHTHKTFPTHTHINIHNRLHLFACAVPLSRTAFPYTLATPSAVFASFLPSFVWLDALAIVVPSPARRALHPQNVPHTARAQPQRQRQIAQSENHRVACISIMMISPPWPAARILVNIWPKANAKLPP